GNQKALALIGGFFAFLWTAGWGVFVYRNPPQAPAKQPTSPPAHERPQYRRRRRIDVRALLALPSFKIWSFGLAAVILVAAGWYAYFYQPTTVASRRVCVGEFEGQCPPHDVFVGCSNPNAWAANNCLKYTSVKKSDVSGNRCGYAIFEVACSQVKK